MDRYAVFGQPVGHSKSPLIHRLFSEQTGQQLFYDKQEVGPEQFEQAVEDFFSSNGKGLNCTVPLKELAWQRADSRSERAEMSGAVNTLKLMADGTLFGDNTDGVGLVNDLTNNLAVELKGKRILLLGAGGAARGVLGALLDCAPACLVIANRTVERAEKLASLFKPKGAVEALGFESLEKRQFDLVLNATAASLSGDLPPLPDSLLAKGAICYDLAYGSEKTPFVCWGEQHGAARSLDGIGMLVEQAAEAFVIWRGVRPETAPVIAELEAQRS